VVRANRTALLWVGVCLLVAAMAVTATFAAAAHPAVGTSTSARRSGPTAVVLMPHLEGSVLAVVDLESGRLLRHVRLRSLVTDIAVDGRSGLVVGAQSGGVGAAADDAVSLTDPHTGSVRYVDLPWPDPARVTCAGGRAYVLHSVVEAPGLAVSVVDPVTASVVATGHAPDGPGAWAATAGSVWSLAVTGGPDPFALMRLDPGDLTARVEGRAGIAPNALVPYGDALLVLGRERGTSGPGGSVRVGLIGETGALRVSGPLAGLTHLPSIATVADGRVVVGDWAGEAPWSRPPWTLDEETLRSSGALPVDGAPCALGSWADRLLVVDRAGGRLLQMDPRSGRTLAVTELGVRDLVYSRVVVVGS